MKTITSRLLLCLALAGLTASWALAQDSTSDTNSKGDVRTVTGCLTKAHGGDEYLLTGADGSTWEIHSGSSSVKLASHVGQTVTAKGVVSHAMAHNMKEDSKDMAKDTHMTKSNTEHGHLKVTDLTATGESCQQ